MNLNSLILFVGSTVLAVTSQCSHSTNFLAQESTKENQDKPSLFALDGMKLPLLFQDDFDAGLQNWKTTDSKAWRIGADGKAKYFSLTVRKSDYQPKFRSPHNIALLNDHKVTDFVLTFDVRNTKDTGAHRDCCVFFCHQSPHEFYYAHLGAKPDPNSGQIMIVRSAARRALTQNKNEIGWDEDWHRVKVTRNAETGQTKVYFDDMEKPVMQFQDRSFRSGQIGLGSFDDTNDFDNFRLYGNPN